MKRLSISISNDITGTNEKSLGTEIFETYEQRVLADGGTVENENCAISSIEKSLAYGLYDDASLFVYPSGYKASKIYAQKPIDGSGDLVFSRTGIKSRMNENGVLENIAINVPSLDFTGGGCGKYNFEPQRTNIALESWNFNNATWLTEAVGVTVTPSADQSLWGDMSATKLIGQSGAGSNIYIRQRSIPTTADRYTFSVLARAGEINTIAITAQNYWVANTIGIFNLETGTFTNENTTARMELWGDGWYFCSITPNANAIAGGNAKFELRLGNDGNITYSGDDVSGLFISDTQMELGTYPTSINRTAGASVTRLSDAPRGLYNGDGIFGTDWAAFCELVVPYEGNSGTGAGFGAKTIEGSILTSDFSFALLHHSSTQLNLRTFDPITDHLIDYTFGGTLKILVRSDGFYFLNGVKYTLTNLSASEPVEIGFGRLGTADFSVGETCRINNSIVEPTLISDAKAIALTTL